MLPASTHGLAQTEGASYGHAQAELKNSVGKFTPLGRLSTYGHQESGDACFSSPTVGQTILGDISFTF